MTHILCILMLVKFMWNKLVL